jgi:hypothetical protein
MPRIPPTHHRILHPPARPCGENCWADEDELGLTDFISEALSRYLKAEVKV